MATQNRKSDRMGKSNFGTKQGNTAEGPPQYHDGFYYTLQFDGMGEWTWRIYDSAMSLIYTGTVLGKSIDYQIAQSNAIDWIDNQSDDFDPPGLQEHDWIDWLNDKCYTVQIKETGFLDGHTGMWNWRVKDIDGVVIYESHGGGASQAQVTDVAGQYLGSLPQQKGCNGDDNGDDNGGGGGEDDSTDTLGDYTVIGMFALLAVAYILFEAFKGESDGGS